MIKKVNMQVMQKGVIRIQLQYSRLLDESQSIWYYKASLKPFQRFKVAFHSALWCFWTYL